MEARNRTCHLLAVVAWGVVVACMMWLPSHYFMAPAGARHHNAALLGTIALTLLVMVGGWRGFRSICAFFHAEG